MTSAPKIRRLLQRPPSQF
ncbi:hypothetical protein CGCVW01_v012594 [Colletotrichum viniferum]|nr:hypothetical protein CGCVW01_v012594 [Colletotrichum viniferum]